MPMVPETMALTPPMVSIILPTYNRARFLPSAFDAIRAQHLEDWELIVVDDGSNDGTRSLVFDLGQGITQPLRYVFQENQGAYAARNTGLDWAQGRYVAFYDSDDVWLPHHIADCVMALEANPDVDWVYGACRMVEFSSGMILAPTTFYEGDRRRPFLGLRTRQVGRLHVIEDPDANRVMILHGLFCGLQNSVIRRRVFEAERFCVRHRHETEDQLIVMRALAAGARLAYFDQVHVVYHVHPDNSSAASGGSLDKLVQITQQLVLALEELGQQVRLNGPERRALRRRLAREYFWHLGYALLWQHGNRRGALEMYRRALQAWPWDLWCWKTYMLATIRTIVHAMAGCRVQPELGSRHGADAPPL
jgi:GT2 family glycosyltransferase